MNILITGGAGYIGSHVAKAFLEQKKHKITILDNLCKGSIKAINALKSVGEFEFVKQNLEDLDALEKLFDERKFEVGLNTIDKAYMVETDYRFKEAIIKENGVDEQSFEMINLGPGLGYRIYQMGY